MIIDMRTYTYHPSTYRPFLKSYQEEGYKITRQFLGFNIGLFTTQSGIVNKTVQWFAYRDHDHRDECRNNYLSSHMKQNFTSGADTLIRQQESLVLVPASFSPINRIDPDHPLLTDEACEKRIFELSTYICKPGRMSEATDCIEKGIFPQARKHAEWVLAYLFSESGQERIYELRAYSTRQSRMERNAVMSADPEYRKAHEELCDRLLDTESIVLEPMPVSAIR